MLQNPLRLGHLWIVSIHLLGKTLLFDGFDFSFMMLLVLGFELGLLSEWDSATQDVLRFGVGLMGRAHSCSG